MGVFAVVCWMLIGHAAATRGLGPAQRHVAWRVAGSVFGPLWLIIRADQARLSETTSPSR